MIKNKSTIKKQTSLIIENAFHEIYAQFNEQSIDDLTKTYLDYKLITIVMNFVSYSPNSVNYLYYFITHSTAIYEFDNETIHEILLSLLHMTNTHPLEDATITTLINTIVELINTFDLSTAKKFIKNTKILITCLNIMQALVDHGYRKSFTHASKIAEALFTNSVVPEVDYQIAWLLFALIKKDQAIAATRDMLMKKQAGFAIVQEKFNQAEAIESNPTSMSQEEAKHALTIAQKEISFYHSWLQLEKLMQNKGLID